MAKPEGPKQYAIRLAEYKSPRKTVLILNADDNRAQDGELVIRVIPADGNVSEDWRSRYAVMLDGLWPEVQPPEYIFRVKEQGDAETIIGKILAIMAFCYNASLTGMRGKRQAIIFVEEEQLDREIEYHQKIASAMATHELKEWLILLGHTTFLIEHFRSEHATGGHGHPGGDDEFDPKAIDGCVYPVLRALIRQIDALPQMDRWELKGILPFQRQYFREVTEIVDEWQSDRKMDGFTLEKTPMVINWYADWLAKKWGIDSNIYSNIARPLFLHLGAYDHKEKEPLERRESQDGFLPE